MSKAKGNAFERTIASRLSERFQTATGLAQAFRRNADSGAYFGKSNIKRLIATGSEHAAFGDILTPRNWRYVLELKAYKDAPTIGQMMRERCSLIDGWLEQVDADALHAGKIAALIVRWNHCPTMVFLPSGLNLNYSMKYRDRIICTLDDWLAQDDSAFFNTEMENL